MVCQEVTPSRPVVLTHGPSGEQAVVRAEDVPDAPGSEATVRVGPVLVRFGPRRIEQRERRDDGRRRAWFDAPDTVRVWRARPLRPAVAAGGSIREFRMRRANGA